MSPRIELSTPGLGYSGGVTFLDESLHGSLVQRKERVGGELPAPKMRAGPGPTICGVEGPEGLSCHVS